MAEAFFLLTIKADVRASDVLCLATHLLFGKHPVSTTW